MSRGHMKPKKFRFDGATMKYRISNTLDPEERLEDAAMAKAMADIMGVEIVSDGDAEFGRGRRFDGKPKPYLPYWDDPVFIANAGRSILVTDVDGANAAIADLHASGRGAFVKATDLKLWTGAVPVGSSLQEVMGEMIYSVLDLKRCLIVQPLCDVRFEMRFVSIDRQIVTYSPIAVHLTPISRLQYGQLFETPRGKAITFQPTATRSMLNLAGRIATECQFNDVIIDCAMIDGKPGVVEFNPFEIGGFGLYACDPNAIARAYARRVKAAQIEEAA